MHPETAIKLICVEGKPIKYLKSLEREFFYDENKLTIYYKKKTDVLWLLAYTVNLSEKMIRNISSIMFRLG